MTITSHGFTRGKARRRLTAVDDGELLEDVVGVAVVVVDQERPHRRRRDARPPPPPPAPAAPQPDGGGKNGATARGQGRRRVGGGGRPSFSTPAWRARGRAVDQGGEGRKGGGYFLGRWLVWWGGMVIKG